MTSPFDSPSRRDVMRFGAIGLPARVAVGFTPGELNADGSYSVFGKNAHAWPEVWFDGIGWVPFEPTPPGAIPGLEALPNE